MASAISLDEYHVLREGCAYVDLRNWSSVLVGGSARQTFLHSFCTNDVKRLRPGESCEAYFTNVKGKIFAHGMISCRDDELVIVGSPGQAASLAAHLDRYVIREDVQIRDASAERSCFLVSKRIGELPGNWIAWELLGRPGSGLLEVPVGDLARSHSELVGRGFVACDEATFQTLRVEAGVPVFGTDFGPENFPQEVGRDGHAISFTKGCYLGQETVARIDALGHVNQGIAGLRFECNNVPAIGQALTHDGASVGQVTSAVFSPRLNRPLALATVRRICLAPGTRLDSAAGPCDVISLPVG